MSKSTNRKPPSDQSAADGITRVSARELIALRSHAAALPLDRNKVRARQGGAYISTFKGRGMEFDESRIYQPGDDIRNMDWRVTARTGRAHTKVFQEERERPVLLWLDLGSTMMFATQQCYKSVLAAKCAALVAWSATANNDRVGGLVFSGDQHSEIKPARGKSAVLKLIGQVSNNPAWQQAGSSNEQSRQLAIARLRSVAHPGSLLFMISDFRHMSHKSWSHLANLSRHNDIVVVHISDPFERSLPEAGNLRLGDGSQIHSLNTGDLALRQLYQQQAVSGEKQLAEFCRKHAIHIVSLSTADNLVTRLREHFAAPQPVSRFARSGSA